MKSVLHNLILFGTFATLAIGIFYNNVRFNVPWYGNNDYVEYSKMVEKPLDNNAISPFAYRIITPTIAHYLHKFGLYFKNRSSTPFEDSFTNYDGEVYDSQIHKALIFTNFIFIVLACVVISNLIKFELEMVQNTKLVTLLQIFIPVLLILSISSIRDAIAPINEAGNLLIISVLLYFYRARKLMLFCLFCFIAIFQRDIAPLIMLIYIGSFFNFKKDYLYMSICLLSLIVYGIIKAKIFPIAGWDYQNDVIFILQNITKIDMGFLLHLMFGNNILYGCMLILFLLRVKVKNLFVFTPYILTALAIILLSNMFIIGNSVDRLLNTALPFLLITLVDLLKLEIAND